MTIQRLDLDGRGHHPLPEDRTALVVATALLAACWGESAADLCSPSWPTGGGTVKTVKIFRAAAGTSDGRCRRGAVKRRGRPRRRGTAP